MDTRSSRRLVFPEKQSIDLEEYSISDPSPGEIRVRTDYSLMSTGTENIVLNHLFDPGTHWHEWVKYPFYPGYCAVGTVESDGEQLRFGDRVAYRGKHHSHSNIPEANCFPIPLGIPTKEAPWFALAKIAFQGVRAAQYKVGDNVMIVGAGPIGQMSVRWAKAAGVATITVVDAAPERLSLATKGGATTVISSPIGEAQEAIRASNKGQMPNIVIDSTGHPQVFSAVLGLVEQFGKVVVLGDTGTPASQSLTYDVVARGITIVGAHDCHNTPQWNDRTITELFFGMVASGRFSLDGLNTHVFHPTEYQSAYDIANRDRAKTMGILFDWTQNL